MVYKESSRTARATYRDPVSKNQQTERREKEGRGEGEGEKRKRGRREQEGDEMGKDRGRERETFITCFALFWTPK